ncbi:MAG: Hsp20/alpha crystallin family protein [Haloarculaceae archaeon]
MTEHVLDHEIELFREPDAYVVLIELREYDAADLDVTWHNNRLHVEAERVDDDGRTRVYQRSLSFPRSIDPDGIDAAVTGETLEVRLPVLAGDDDEAVQIAIEG